jgi:pyruvate dehydrogenase E2 component (dihydrolipoamide acetyltransferase)
MALEFRFPDVGEGIHEGEIVRWLVKKGDQVRPDQPLVEVETDKAVVEIPAPRAGTILHLAVGAGEKIQVGEVLWSLVRLRRPQESAASASSRLSVRSMLRPPSCHPLLRALRRRALRPQPSPLASWRFLQCASWRETLASI